jgi:hypothetical protein
MQRLLEIKDIYDTLQKRKTSRKLYHLKVSQCGLAQLKTLAAAAENN